MFPLLPILILLFLGPANAERLAAEGRLPQALLAVHLAQTSPAQVCVAVPVESTARVAVRKPRARVVQVILERPLWRAAVRINAGCPTRAGPVVA